MNYTNQGSNQAINDQGLIFDIKSLYAFLERVPDTRKPRGRLYVLPLLLLLMLLAKLGGEDTPSGMADWVAHRIDELYEMNILPKKKAPSHMTYRRTLQTTIQPDEFEGLVSEYHQSCLQEGQEVVFSLDGKTLKGTILFGETRGTHLLSIFVPGQGLVLVEAEVDRKENEIVVAPKILQQVNLTGALVIGDAMHAQRQVSKQVVEAGGEYMWTIKGNQWRTQWAIEKLFVREVCNLKKGAPLSQACQMTTEVGKGHGRIEKRTILVSNELNEYLDWPYVGQVFRIEREIWYEKYRGRTREVVYGLTSLTPKKASPKKLLKLNRQYWGIENGLHYRRDVTLHEDATRLTKGKAGHNMAILNNLTVGICLKHGLTNLAKARRLFSAKPKQALALLTSA